MPDRTVEIFRELAALEEGPEVLSPQFCQKVTWANWGSHQCSRKPWKDGYCKQHHPDTVKYREAKRTAKWDAERKCQQIEEARSAVADAAMKWYWSGCAAEEWTELEKLCAELAALKSETVGNGSLQSAADAAALHARLETTGRVAELEAEVDKLKAQICALKFEREMGGHLHA